MTARGRVAIWVAAACVLVAVLLAPAGGAGICVDAQEPSKSYCRDWLVSIVGMETNPWLWLGVTAAVLLFGLAAWRRAGRGVESAQRHDAPTGPADRHPSSAGDQA